MIKLNEGTDEFLAVKKTWEEKAKECTLETLPLFLKDLTENYQHDYGTICHATAIASIAAAWAMNKTDQGGITGFQAGAVMWEFIKSWSYSSNKTGLKIIDYDNLLFPQYADLFDKVMSQNTWLALQKEAAEKISKANEEYEAYAIESEKYKTDIAAFIAKFPDYEERQEFYNHLGMGTGAQWEAEKEKKSSGFEFAPRKPYCPINSSSPVYQHWQSIVSGAIPFGFGLNPVAA